MVITEGYSKSYGIDGNYLGGGVILCQQIFHQNCHQFHKLS